MADASTKVVLGASIAHITSGASIAAGAFSASTDVDVGLTGTSNLSSYPRCDLVLTYRPQSSTSSTAMTIPCYRRDLNVGGNTSFDNTAPGLSNSNLFVGAFAIPATVSTGTHYVDLVDVPLPGGNTDCEFYIQNSLTNSIGANGWDLVVIPKADVGATT